MKPIIEGPAPPVTESEIIEVEKRIGRPIPAEYRKFLVEHNGGRPKQPCDFSMHDLKGGRDQIGTVDRFLGINADEFFNLEHYLKIYRDRIPPNLFLIAYDPGGNLIGVSTEGKDAGAVYFWDHEFEAEEGQPPTYDNLYLIADSFDQFLDTLCASS